MYIYVFRSVCYVHSFMIILQQFNISPQRGLIMHHATTTTTRSADRQAAALNAMADAMVAVLTNDFCERQQDALSPIASNDPLQWTYVPYHLRR